MRRIHFVVMTIVVLPWSPLVAATQDDVRGISQPPVENRIIDEKCLGCHNRKKIEAARKQQKNVDKVMRQMEEKGVTLTEADRQVLGHFWQQDPLKKRK